MGVKARPVLERFIPKVRVIPCGGCWEWTASLQPSGYGQIHGPDGQTLYTHRYSYELAYGPIPEGLYIDHVCRNRACCNPMHLRAVTPQVNATENSTSRAALYAARTVCDCGHPFDRLSVGRSCPACRRRRRGREGQPPALPKLDPVKAEEIRRRHSAGERNGDLARAFGVSPVTICDVVKRRIYA